MRIYRNCTRTVHLGSAVALHCAARTAGAFSSMIMLTVSRPVAIRFSHGTHRGCRHIATDFPCVLCIVMHPPRIFSGSHSRTEKMVCTLPQVELICPYQPLLMFATNGATIRRSRLRQ